MDFTILPFTSADLPALRVELLEVYRRAFGAAPFFETEADVEGFAFALERHVYRAEFHGLIARRGTVGAVIGFAYGYTSHIGQWWHDTVAGAMPAEMARHWLADCFELVELAVTPQEQGKGAGGRLHDRILTGLPHATAVLSTRQGDTPALRLYRRRGWVPLLDDFHFPGNPARWVILGRELRAGYA